MIKQNGYIILTDLKATSINKSYTTNPYTGRRIKTKSLSDFKDLLFVKLHQEVGKEEYGHMDFNSSKLILGLDVIFGMSNIGSDVDNGLKSFQDGLSKYFGFNDNKIYKLQSQKVKVEKGEEFIAFRLSVINKPIFEF